MRDNKSHIGIYLNLDRPDDREIHRILQNIPSYVSKASYIKQAIAFYGKNCGNNNEIYVTQNLPKAAESKKAPEEPPKQEKKQEQNPEEKRRENTPKEKVKEEKKKEPPVKNVPDLVPEQKKEEPPKAQTESAEGNNLIVTNDSDIDDTVDYMGVVEGFFN